MTKDRARQQRLSSDVIPQAHSVILDACCAINLIASGYMTDILQSFQVETYVADYVAENELEAIRLVAEEAHEAEEMERIDIGQYVDSGLLRVAALELESEEIAFVNFAASLDDGEAISAALAVSRHWDLATDDRKSIKFLGVVSSELRIVTTPQLLKHWVDTMQPKPEIVALALSNVQTRGRYWPRTRHRLYSWWQSQLG